MEVLKEYKLNEKQVKQSFIIGIVTLILGVLMFIFIGNLILIPIGILNIVIGVLNKNLKIVQIFPDHFEIQRGVIASKKLIKYKNLISFKRSKRFLEFNYSSNEDGKKSVKLHLNALTEKDIQEICNVLKDKTDLGDENYFKPSLK